MIKLGVNVDHVATVRQARGGRMPSPVEAAKAALRGRADGITVHLREDRRHIQEHDVISIKNEVALPLNLEMASEEALVQFAIKVKPHKACLVPEKREELTTEGGLNVFAERERVTAIVRRLEEVGIEVSLFVDPEEDQIHAAKATGASFIELHTGTYANTPPQRRAKALEALRRAAEQAHALGLGVNAGHGLDYENTFDVLDLPYLVELNIGHAIVAEALTVGMERAVHRMKEVLKSRVTSSETVSLF